MPKESYFGLGKDLFCNCTRASDDLDDHAPATSLFWVFPTLDSPKSSAITIHTYKQPVDGNNAQLRWGIWLMNSNLTHLSAMLVSLPWLPVPENTSKCTMLKGEFKMLLERPDKYGQSSPLTLLMPCNQVQAGSPQDPWYNHYSLRKNVQIKGITSLPRNYLAAKGKWWVLTQNQRWSKEFRGNKRCPDTAVTCL